MKKRIANILFWAVISAAFIGPGTITTAAAAGTNFGYAIVWALVFSTVACIILQEASARLTLSSGSNIGEALQKYLSKSPAGKAGLWVIIGAVVLGCAAYEAGNILGAVAGSTLVFDLPSHWFVVGIGGITFLLFWFGSVDVVAKCMGCIVAFMGCCFFATAIIMQPDFGSLFTQMVVPGFPDGSSTLILALIGTTVVPYNIFLGSGIAHEQNLKEMRWSLSIAIGLGGLISIAVLVVGTAISGSFTFEALATAMNQQLGNWAGTMLGLGLFAAGLSSSITAPLAAAITVKSVSDHQRNGNGRWGEKGRYFRSIWILVLLIGLGFGLSGVQPVPAIILAQALNGIILPLVAVGLLVLVNNVELMPAENINTRFLNIVMSVVVFATIIIGVRNVGRALANSLPVNKVGETYIIAIAAGIALLISWPVYRLVRKVRSGAQETQ